MSAALSLVDTRYCSVVASIVETLERFGDAALGFTARRGIRVIPIRRGQRYADASPALDRICAGVDDWPAPPAGLFVVEERAIYLRSHNAMTVAHEFGHAIDCALGDGVYHSSTSHELRTLFSNARDFVTPYAATGIDEYFAEGLRAFVECNDPSSFWPRATRERLRGIDTQLYEYITSLFASGFEAAA